MEDSPVTLISAGLSQKGVRDHNARLLMSLVQRHGSMPASDLARMAELSPPTVSSILRRLEGDGLVERGAPVRGKVGKPSVPMRLAPDGAFSFGLKVGRRSSELILMDFSGAVRHERMLTYEWPVPEPILAFVETGVSDILSDLSPRDRQRISGIGIGAPFEMWNSHHLTTGLSFPEWRDVDLRDAVARRTGFDALLMNDATAACQAEHTYGRGREFRDYAYFFIGAYIGGGIALNNAVYEGRHGNAGALGSLRSISPNGESMQLVDMASIRQLEQRLAEVDIDASQLWSDPESWSSLSRYVDPWIGRTAQELAKAAMSTCSVIDFEAIVIDGAFPPSIRDQLVSRVRRYAATQDLRGLVSPRIEAGSIGRKARAIGAASRLLSAQFMLNASMV